VSCIINTEWARALQSSSRTPRAMSEARVVVSWWKIKRRVRLQLDRNRDVFCIKLHDKAGAVIWEKPVSICCADARKGAPVTLYSHLSDRLEARTHKCNVNGLNKDNLDILSDYLYAIANGLAVTPEPLPDNILEDLFDGAHDDEMKRKESYVFAREAEQEAERELLAAKEKFCKAKKRRKKLE